MSGLASGVTKVFSTIGSGVAKLGSAVKGVGASLFTGAAAGGQSILGGGLSSLFGSGTLGKMFGGATKVIGGSGSSLLGSAAADTLGGATRGFGAATGGIGVAGSGALALADTATGMAPTGVSAAAGATKGLGDWFSNNSDLLTNLAGGVGEGLMAQETMDNSNEQAQMDRQALVDKEQRLRASYEVPANVLPGGSPMVDKTRRPTPAVAYAGGKRIVYDPKAGQIVEVAAV